MKKLDAAQTAALLTELSRRTALAGGPPYRARAYARAAESIATLASPLDAVIAQGRLREIPGVGETIADIITKLHHTGIHPTLEKLRRDYPAGVLEMLSIPGIRPEKAGKLYSELGIETLADLEAAAREDRLKGLKGFGPALQRKILDGLQIRNSTPGARHVHRAAALLEAAERDLRRNLTAVTQVTAAGDFRRGTELISNLALVAEGNDTW